MFINVFRKSGHLRDNVEEYGSARYDTDDRIWGMRALHEPYYIVTYGYKHIFRMIIILFHGRNGFTKASYIYTYTASLV